MNNALLRRSSRRAGAARAGAAAAAPSAGRKEEEEVEEVEEEEEEEEETVLPQYEWVDASHALRGGGKAEVRLKLKASYTSSLRPHTQVAEGRIH